MDTLIGLAQYLIPFLVVLTALVFVHELGHYLVARYNGVKVEVFSIGFGPELFGWNDRHQTRWKVSLFPLGGYVKMFGDADASSKPDVKNLQKLSDDLKQHSLFYKSVWQRIAVTAAGPAANYLFAIVIFAGIFITVGQRVTPPVIGEVLPDSPAAQADLMPGDKVLKVNQTSVERFEQLAEVIRENPGKPMDFEIQRGQENIHLTIEPKLLEIKDRFGYTHKMGSLGIKGGKAEFISQNPITAIFSAVKEVFVISWKTLEAIGQMLTGVRSSDEIGGILRIAQMSGDVVGAGTITFLWFMALLSINLGLINLFPVPMLDGGHLLFYFIEAVRGKPLPEKTQEVGFTIGLLLVAALFLFSTWNDVKQLKFFQSVLGWFS